MNAVYSWIFYKTALHIAVAKANTPIIKLLLSKPEININVKDEIFILFFQSSFIQNWMVIQYNLWKKPEELALDPEIKSLLSNHQVSNSCFIY